MQKGCMKKMRCSIDRISHLPDKVIGKILTCMPLHDAVRTSVLSRKWRFAWVTIPQLIFDEEFYRKLRRSPSVKLMRIIFQVILLHRGPIAKFKLSLPLLVNCPEIDQLIYFVSNNSIQEFILHVRQGNAYKLPSSIFSCLQLKRLELNFCLFNPPLGFQGFGKLLSLELWDVVITPEVFSSLISSSPLLERLKVVNCSTDYSDLEIAAPNLKSLFCASQFSSLCLKNTHKLARVSISLYESMPWETYEGGDKWVTFFASLPGIEFLELDHGCLELLSAGGVPERLPRDLSCLKSLNLRIETADVFSSILCLLRSSPNLEKIAIGVPIYRDGDEEAVEKLFEVQRCSDISLNRLREVELQQACGTMLELELIKLLLAKSPVLQKMAIVPDDLMYREQLKLMKTVTEFRRSSPLAEVSCEVPDDN